MWYVCDVLYAVLYVRVSCFVVRGCAVSRRYINVCNCDLFSVNDDSVSDDTTCDCTEEPQTMEHLLNCPLLPQACTTDDLLIYNDTAQRCVKQWMTKV